ERELHLGLDARHSEDPAPRCALGEVLEQGRLADAGLSANDEDRALSAPYALQVPVQDRALVRSAVQHLVSFGGRTLPAAVRLPGGRYWSRTSDLCRVKAALYR